MSAQSSNPSNSLLGTYPRCPLRFVRGEGAELFTEDGTAYLDFASGIAVNALGHCDPEIVKVLQEQATKLWHVSNMYQIPEQEALGQKLVDLTFADKVFFTNSGAEAVECALKGARRYQYDKGHAEKYKIIGFQGAFHGRTIATIAAAGNENYTTGFGPILDGFINIELHNIDLVKQAISSEVAGIIIEPVQGEGGVQAVDPAFLRQLRKLCTENDIALIFDEVQCGVGRSGKLFAHEYAGVTPDIMCVAKGIGNGFPLGACLFEEAFGAPMVPGTHGSTYGGNPLGCAVGLATLNKISQPEFLAHVEEMASYFSHQLQQLLQKHHEMVVEVRGLGLMRGLKLNMAPKDMVVRLRELGLLTVAAGENTLRLLPPLIIDETHIDRAIALIDQALSEVA